MEHFFRRKFLFLRTLILQFLTRWYICWTWTSWFALLSRIFHNLLINHLLCFRRFNLIPLLSYFICDCTIHVPRFFACNLLNPRHVIIKRAFWGWECIFLNHGGSRHKHGQIGGMFLKSGRLAWKRIVVYRTASSSTLDSLSFVESSL